MQTSPLSGDLTNYAVPPAPVLTHTALGPVEHTGGGNGRSLLALHGALGGYDQSWLLGRALLAELAGFSLLAVSRPGYLGTPLSLGRTPSEQADLYAALLDARGIDRTLAAAVSAGGPSAIEFALRHPDRCAGLILASAPNASMAGSAQSLSRIRRVASSARIPGLLPILRWRAGQDPQATIARAVPDTRLRAGLLAHGEARALLVAVQQGAMKALSRRLPGTRHDTELFSAIAPLPLHRLAVPVLAIHATDDPVVDVTHAQRVLGEAPFAKGLVVPDGGHVALFVHLAAVRQAVIDFLAAVP